MKGFIEVTVIFNGSRAKTLINAKQILTVAEVNGRTGLRCIDDDGSNIIEESYEEIKAKIAEAVGEMPAADVVSKKEFEQVKWERDTAIGQLESYGVGFCENKELKEVKHGEWFLLDECANEGVYCSVCYKKVYKADYANQKLKSKYCPNCGARMKGGVTDTNVGGKTEKGR